MMRNSYLLILCFILAINLCFAQTAEKNITWYHTLKEVSISPNARPDTVSGSKQWMIFDFAFCEKGILKRKQLTIENLLRGSLSDNNRA